MNGYISIMRKYLALLTVLLYPTTIFAVGTVPVITGPAVMGVGSGTAAPGPVTVGPGLAINPNGLVTSSLINAQTGTSYTISTTDYAKLITFNNTSAVAVSLPAATTTGFGSGFSIDVQNLGAGLVTITPTTSTINNSSTLTIPQNSGCSITSDGTNYQVSSCSAIYGSTPKVSTAVICAPDTANATGCNVTVPSSGAQTLINSTIANCATSEQTSFTGSITGTTLTVSGSVSGAPIYIGEPIGNSGTTNPTYIVSGSGTTWTVNQNHAVSSSTFTGPWPGCKVVFRAGTYNISGSIIIDRSDITLEGENTPMWGGYIAGWSGVNPAGTIGMNAKIQQVGSGYNLIQVNHTNVPDGGEGRHRAITVSRLYLVGSSTSPPYTDYGIFDQVGGAGGDDSVTISDNMIQRVIDGVRFSLDTPWLYHNNIQDVSGTCFNDLGSVWPKVTNNICYDSGGGGYDNSSGGSGAIIANNTFGDLQTAIRLGHESLAIGNVIGSVLRAAIEIDGVLGNVSSNTIDYNLGSDAGQTRTKPAIWFCNGCESGIPSASITNNVLSGHNEASGIYAIDATNAATGTSIANNQVNGTWNNGVSPFINSASTAFIANFPIVVDATNQEFGADPTGIADSTTAINNALSTQRNSIYPTVHIPSGNYKISNALALQGGQCLYGDGDHSTFLNVGSNFSPSATGIITMTGQETASPCLHDVAIIGAVPPGLNTTTSAAQASGTTIQVNASIPVNYYVDDTTTSSAIPALTYVTNVTGSGPFTLTLSATVTGVLNGDTVKANPNRASFAALGSCTTNSGGTGCQYPPAIYDVSANRPRIWNIYAAGLWAGFDFTGGSIANIVPWIENISIGALTYAIRLDGGQDFSHIKGWHNWQFGLNGNDSNNAYHDGSTYCAQIGRMDGLNVLDFDCFDSIFNITANASNSGTPSHYTNVMMDGNPAQVIVAGGFDNQLGICYKTGSTSSNSMQFSGGTSQLNGCDIEQAGSVTYVNVTGGTVKFYGGKTAVASGSTTSYSVSSGTLDIEGMYFNLPGTLSTPVISQTSTGVLILKGNTCHPGTSGTFVSIGADVSGNDIEGNNCQGYTYTVPGGNTLGFYNLTNALTLYGSSSAFPVLNFLNISAASNQKEWQWNIGGGSMNLLALTDAGGGSSGSANTGNIFNISRSGQSITDIGVGNSSNNPTFHFNSTAAASFGGSVSISQGLLTGATNASVAVTSGSCVVSGATGGSPNGEFTASTGGTSCQFTITFNKAAANRYVCTPQDITTTANAFLQVSPTGTSSCIVAGSPTTGDLIMYQAGGH